MNKTMKTQKNSTKMRTVMVRNLVSPRLLSGTLNKELASSIERDARKPISPASDADNQVIGRQIVHKAAPLHLLVQAPSDLRLPQKAHTEETALLILQENEGRERPDCVMLDPGASAFVPEAPEPLQRHWLSHRRHQDDEGPPTLPVWRRCFPVVRLECTHSGVRGWQVQGH